jgi:hypothetical protein
VLLHLTAAGAQAGVGEAEARATHPRDPEDADAAAVPPGELGGEPDGGRAERTALGGQEHRVRPITEFRADRISATMSMPPISQLRSSPPAPGRIRLANVTNIDFGSTSSGLDSACAPSTTTNEIGSIVYTKTP